MLTQEQFAALCAFLDSPEGCNFREGETGNSTWTCDGTLAMTTAWMQAAGIDPEMNLPRLRQGGGHCDCEVVFNLRDCWPLDQTRR